MQITQLYFCYNNISVHNHNQSIATNLKTNKTLNQKDIIDAVINQTNMCKKI